MQNKYKKVQNIYIELEEKSLLLYQKYETRHGLCELEGHKKKCIIKIFTINNQPDNLRLIECMRNMAKRTQSLKNNPYIVECYSSQRTQNKFYIAFKKYKNSLSSIQLDQFEILSMLASMIQLLKLFAQKGECHGNLKPSNIFPQKKLNTISSFTTTDYFYSKYSNNLDHEYIDPEMTEPSIASDIYSLGKIVNYALKNRICQYQWVIEQMICPKQNRIQLDKLEMEVEKIIENYEQKGLRNELNKKGITEEFLTKIISRGIEQHSQVGMEEFQCNIEVDFALRNRAQYFYNASQEIRQCQSVQSSLIDFLILSFLSESLNCYKECLKITRNKVLKSLILKDYNQLVIYLEKVNLHCELFIQDLSLKQLDTTNLQKYLQQYSQPNNLLSNALSLVIEDIINKNLGKEFKFNEEMDRSEIIALNFIFFTNKMEKGIIYDYKRLNEYIRCLQSIQ